MIMVRELTDDEIKEIGNSFNIGEYPTDWDMIKFAKALFEAARIQQTVRE